MNVLIVDDSSTMRHILARSMRQAGFTIDVTEAPNGIAALQVFDPDTCDLVLADWNMPELNGIEFARNLRRAMLGRAERRHIPVIMVTTEGGTEREKQAREAGLDGFLTKPFTPEELGRVVREVLARVENGGRRE